MTHNNDPAISIIIPTYNRANLIGKSINSVLNQTFKDFEIIIVDDGSTDNTENIVKNFDDRRIRYIKNKRNKGACAARNAGIKIAKGKYIAFQDSDDEWLPEKLEKQIKFFRTAKSKIGIVYTAYWQIKNGNKIYMPPKRVKQRNGNIYKELLKSSFIGNQTILLKKECFKKSGVFDENLPRLQDWDLVLRLAKYYDFKFIDDPLVLYHYNSDSISTNYKMFSTAIERMIIKHFKNSNNKLVAKHYFRTGTMLCLCGALKEGRNYFIKSIKLNPLNISLVAFSLSFLGQKYFSKFENIYIRIRESL